MCILCVIQKWSRRVATMLPWLVIPLIGLWALSQLLPPAFRFEITSPRLACLFVLLVTLFWYEILMPRLSSWRAKRNARLRERKRFEAIELQKLRKTATRRCRNCLTPYREQNPGGGRFMCSYCGHISKRPVLDLPVPPGLGLSGSGIIKDLVGKGGKMFNGKGWAESGWMCSHDWVENGNWPVANVGGSSNYRRKNTSGLFGGDEHCLAEKSYSGVVIFACKLLTSFVFSIRWICRKIFRAGSPGDESSTGADQKGMLGKRGENGVNCHESRGEKARRKAEEKRQARLEKELLEEEERKQREEVARLVEERRRLRDEMMKVEKDRNRALLTTKEKDRKKEAEKKRQERRKDKDKGSSKSNSDAEELERRSAGKETEWKHELESSHREHEKHITDDARGSFPDNGPRCRNASTLNSTRGSMGNRYLDRVKGTFLSSSKAFTGGSFFCKGSSTPGSTAKENKSNSSLDYAHTHVHRRDLNQPDRMTGKSMMSGDDRVISRPVLSEPQPSLAPKKAWHQLFTRSPVNSSPNVNVIGRPNQKSQPGVDNQFQSSKQLAGIQTFDNPISFGLPSPFTVPPYSAVVSSTGLGSTPSIEATLPRFCVGSHGSRPGECEQFEDPCYVPDPISLLGPVSESLDNFQLDVGAGYRAGMKVERPHTGIKNLPISSEVSQPSPIEYPLSRPWADERQNASNLYPSTPKGQEVDANVNDKGIWQMWSSSPPLGRDGLGLVDSLGLLGNSASWFLPQDRNGPNKEDFVLPSQNTSASLFTNGDPVLSSAYSPREAFLGNNQSTGAFSPGSASSNHDPWAKSALFPPLSGSNNSSFLADEEVSKVSSLYGSSDGSVSDHPFEPPQENFWPKKGRNSAEGACKQSAARPSSANSLFSKSDVQSFW